MAGTGCVLGGREMSSLSVACYIGSKIESLLGNSISVKCLVEDDRSVFASCAAEILENLEVKHPAYYIINDACQNHHKTYGCCCKTLLVMIKLWAESAQELLEHGVPIQAIVSGFQEGLEACISSLQPVCINVSHFHHMGIDTIIANSVDSPAGRKQCVSTSIKDKAAWEKDGHLSSLIESNAVWKDGTSLCSQENVFVDKAELSDKCEYVNGATNCGILSGNSAENNTGTNQSGQSANKVISDDHITCRVDREDGHLTNKVDSGTVDQDDPNDISWYFADGQVPAPPSLDQETLDLLDRSSRLLTSMVLPGQNTENGRNRMENSSVFENPVPTNFDAFDHFSSSDVNVYSHCHSKHGEVPGNINDSSCQGHMDDTEGQGHLTGSDDEFDSCFDEIQYKTKTELPINGRTGKTHFGEKKIQLKNKTGVLEKREMNESSWYSPSADSTTIQTKTCLDVLGETVLGETLCSGSNVDSLALQPNSDTVTRQSQSRLCDINSGITFESGPQTGEDTECSENTKQTHDKADIRNLFDAKIKEKLSFKPKQVFNSSRHYKTSETAAEFSTAMLQSTMQQSAKISKLGFSSRHLSGLESNTTAQQIKNVTENKVDSESESAISNGIINASSADKNEYHIDSGNIIYPKVSLNLKNESDGTSHAKRTEITVKIGTFSNNESETNKNESESAKWTLSLEQFAECLSQGAVEGIRQAAAVVDHQMKILAMKGAEAGSIQLDQVHTCVLEGPLACNSCVVEGLVVMATADSMPLVVETQQEGKRTLLIHGDVTPSFRQRGFKESVIAKSVLSTQEYMRSREEDDNWLREVKDLLTQLSIQLLLVQGAVSEAVQDWCGTQNIIVLSHVPYRVLAAIMSSAGVDQLTHLLLGTQDHVVHGVTVAPWSEDWLYRVTSGLAGQHVVVKHSGLSQTAILCHPAGSVVHLAEEQFWHCLRRLASIVQSGLVLPGGGETEAWCMQHLTQLADEKRSHEQEYSGDAVYFPAVYQSLAKSFLRFKDIVSRNSCSTLCDPTAGNITDASFSKFRQTIGSQCYVRATGVADKTRNSDITENSDVTASDRDITDNSDVTSTLIDVTKNCDVTASDRDITRNSNVTTTDRDITRNSDVTTTDRDITRNSDVTTTDRDITRNSDVTTTDRDITRNSDVTTTDRDITRNSDVTTTDRDITRNSNVTTTDRDITRNSDVTTTHSDVTKNSDVTLVLPVLDDCQSKVESWRTALRTVCLLLQTDTYVMTGIDPCDGKILAEFSGIL